MCEHCNIQLGAPGRRLQTQTGRRGRRRTWPSTRVPTASSTPARTPCASLRGARRQPRGRVSSPSPPSSSSTRPRRAPRAPARAATPAGPGLRLVDDPRVPPALARDIARCLSASAPATARRIPAGAPPRGDPRRHRPRCARAAAGGSGAARARAPRRRRVRASPYLTSSSSLRLPWRLPHAPHEDQQGVAARHAGHTQAPHQGPHQALPQARQHPRAVPSRCRASAPAPRRSRPTVRRGPTGGTCAGCTGRPCPRRRRRRPAPPARLRRAGVRPGRRVGARRRRAGARRAGSAAAREEEGRALAGPRLG